MSTTLTTSFAADAGALQGTDLFSIGAPNSNVLASSESGVVLAQFSAMLGANEAAGAVPSTLISRDGMADTDFTSSGLPAVQAPVAEQSPPPSLTLTFHPSLLGQFRAALHRALKAETVAPGAPGLPAVGTPSFSQGERVISPELAQAECATPCGELSIEEAEEQEPAALPTDAEKISELLRQGVVIIEYIFRTPIPPTVPTATSAPVAGEILAAPATTAAAAALTAKADARPDLALAGAATHAASAVFASSTSATPAPVVPAAVASLAPSSLSQETNTRAAPISQPIPASTSPTPPAATPAAALAQIKSVSSDPARVVVSTEMSPAEKLASTASPVSSAQPTAQTPSQAPARQAATASSFFPQAKVAAQSLRGLSLEPARDLSSVGRSDKKSLTVDSKSLMTGIADVGMSTAKSNAAMSFFTPDALATNPFTAVSSLPATVERAWRVDYFPAEASTPSLSSQAVHVVREISDIADGLWATERNFVELRFNFEGHDQLSVRVEYRDGDVCATFRTNSSELHEALHGEWQNQQAKQGPVPYTMLPPVFENAAAPSSRSGFSFNENAARDQNAQQFSQHARDDAHSGGKHPRTFFPGEAETPTRVTPSAPSTARHPSARLLHTQA